jgi:MFS family permease
MDYLRRPVLGNLLLQFACFGLAFSGFMSGFALFAERRFTYHGHAVGPREIGYLFTFFGLLGIFFQGYLLGKLVKRYGEERLVTAGFLSLGLGYAALVFAFHLPILMTALIVASFGSGAVRPALTSLVTRNASRSEQGEVLGVNQSVVSLTQVVAPIVSGHLIEWHYLNGWALSIGGAALAGLFFSRRRRVH